MSEKMTLEQVRNTLENWPADMPIPHIRDLAAAIDAHLAILPAAVPDAMKPHLFRETDDSEETARGEGYVDGWNACREAMLTQRSDAQNAT